jgi:hypothetical protein
VPVRGIHDCKLFAKDLVLCHWKPQGSRKAISAHGRRGGSCGDGTARDYVSTQIYPEG